MVGRVSGWMLERPRDDGTEGGGGQLIGNATRAGASVRDGVDPRTGTSGRVRSCEWWVQRPS